MLAQGNNGILDLVHLDSGIDQETDVVETNANDLDSVLQTKGIIDEDNLIDETENVEGQEGRDCA